MSASQLQPSGRGSTSHDSSPSIKLEPREPLHRLGLLDSTYRTQLPEAMRPSKRPATDEDPRPNKFRSGSASPGSLAVHGQDRLFFQSQVRPISSPRPASRPFAPPRQSTRLQFQQDAVEHDDVLYEDTKILSQPETRPISQE